jgi:hypothetical protein
MWLMSFESINTGRSRARVVMKRLVRMKDGDVGWGSQEYLSADYTDFRRFKTNKRKNNIKINIGFP